MPDRTRSPSRLLPSPAAGRDDAPVASTAVSRRPVTVAFYPERVARATPERMTSPSQALHLVHSESRAALAAATARAVVTSVPPLPPPPHPPAVSAPDARAPHARPAPGNPPSDVPGAGVTEGSPAPQPHAPARRRPWWRRLFRRR